MRTRKGIRDQKRVRIKMQQTPGDSIWGKVNQCVEVAIEIFYLWGERGKGLAVSKEYAEKNLSAQTVAAGKEEDGRLYYEIGDTIDAPLMEILGKLDLTKKVFVPGEVQEQMRLRQEESDRYDREYGGGLVSDYQEKYESDSGYDSDSVGYYEEKYEDDYSEQVSLGMEW
ncbi:MAG: hypothetical protein LBV33_02880 [Lachnospiraceae bacterium]|jgi:hypothetical protein|nr:hypothetical protein [Lachnospiraceae bacterium]